MGRNHSVVSLDVVRTIGILVALGSSALNVACSGKERATDSEMTFGTTSDSTDGENASTSVIVTSTTGEDLCMHAPSTACGDYIGALVCCGVIDGDGEAGAFWTESCHEYTQSAPGDCRALLEGALVCLTALPCGELLEFRAAYTAMDATWKAGTCGAEVQAALAAGCTDWWSVG